jgi:protein ImuA
VEEGLLHPKLWRGRRGWARWETLPTGFSELDRTLPGGGWPRAGITEIIVDRYGIGELALLMPALAFLSQQQTGADGWLVLVSPPLIPYAPALQRYGIDLNRLLLVHTRRDQKKTLWAAEQAICSRSSAAALVWLPAADMTALRRLQLGAEEQKCWTVLFRPRAALRLSSPAALRLGLSPAGPKTCVQILKCRGSRPFAVNVDPAAWQ